MSVSNISSSVNIPTCMSFAPSIDSEEQAIMEKLLSYGITPTGNKASDRALLHRVELQKAKDEVNTSPEGSVSAGKFLTISQGEINSMTDKKKEQKKELNPQEMRKGAETIAAYNQFFIDKTRRKEEQK